MAEKEIRLSMEEVEKILKKAKLLGANEAISQIHIEPGELIVTIVK
jgi:hypothetical protein